MKSFTKKTILCGLLALSLSGVALADAQYKLDIDDLADQGVGVTFHTSKGVYKFLGNDSGAHRSWNDNTSDNVRNMKDSTINRIDVVDKDSKNLHENLSCEGIPGTLKPGYNHLMVNTKTWACEFAH